MSRLVIVDSSVAVKWFAPDAEAGTAEALDLLERHRDEEIELAAPSLMRLEVLNVFWARRLRAKDLLTISSALEALRLTWYPIDASLSAAAGGLAARHRLTVYDATFAALARDLDAVLVTADRKLAVSKACEVRLL